MPILSPRYASWSERPKTLLRQPCLRVAIVVALLAGPPRLVAMDFERGDSNADGAVNIADAIYLLNYLYQDGPTPTCLDTADVNDDGTVDIADAVYGLSMLKGGGPLPPPPFNQCGDDPTPDTVDCVSYAPCP